LSTNEELDELVYAARSHHLIPPIVQRADQLDAVLGMSRDEVLAQKGVIIAFGQQGTPGADDE
jgi:hypothetical protein